MRAHSFSARGGCAPSVPAALATLLVTAWAVSPAHALQVLDARDGVAVEAILSIKEATRIRIEGAPITDVFGNIHSSNCAGGLPTSPGAVVATPAVNPGGEIVLECDRDKGEIYIRPVGESAKPVNLFISSAQATYTLVLRRSDTPADTIVIRDRTPRQALPASTLAQASPGRLGPSAHHVRAMKAMLVVMASDRVPADIRVDEINQPMQLWPEAKFALLRRYEGRGLVGEKYLLHNLGPAAMVLAEAEFDREGAQVVGVAVEQHRLRPGESTSVFVIRRGAEQ
jgi:conjugal transfer pilus assembly protein TraK